MKSSSWHFSAALSALLTIVTLGAVTTPARADGKIAAMGVRSLDGEDELERRLSAALRNGASGLTGFSVSDRELSLEQMSVAYGCDEPDAACLGEIAKALSVTHLVYGSVVDASAGYELTLNAFSASSGRVETAVARGTQPAQLAGGQAKETLVALLRQLFGIQPEPVAPATVGRLHLTGGTARAAVLIDGTGTGVLDDEGSLLLEVPAGKHSVRIEGTRASDERVALVKAGATTELALTSIPAVAVSERLPKLRLDDEPPPVESHGPSIKRVLGWTSVAVGTAFALATIYAWVQIEKINDDDDYLAYRAAFPRTNLEGGVSNVCSRAKRGELATKFPDQAALEGSARDLCDQASTLEMLQYVFIGGTVLGAGVGTWLLLSARNEPARTTVRLSPRFGAQSASLAATLSF